MNKIHHTIFILCLIFIPIGIHALTQADLIEETLTITIPFDINLTKNTDYIVCIKTNNVACVDGEDLITTYNYSYSSGSKTDSFLKLYNLFEEQGISSAADNYYCDRIDSVTDGSLKINTTCNSAGGGGETLIDNRTYNVSIGNISIIFSSGEQYNQYVDKVLPGETITMKLQSNDISDEENPLDMGTSDADIFYNVYNLKTGEVISGLSNRQIGEVGGDWIEEFTIPQTAPVGIISFNVKAGTDFGGNYVIYRSIPVNSQLELNETAINMGESVFINLTNTVYYGDISEINTTIEYPNGTNETIILNEGNNYDSIFTTPTNQQGTYNVSVALTHTNGYTTYASRTFFVREYTIDVAKIKTIYSPGETVSISAALLDFDYNAVPSEINFTFFDSVNDKIKTYSNSETILVNNYREVAYILPYDAINGKYSIEIVVKDEHDIIYLITEQFNVGDLLDYTDVEFLPELINLNITTLNTITKRVNLTNLGSPITEINMSIENHTDYMSLNLTTLDKSLATEGETYFYLKITPEDDMPLGIITSKINIHISDMNYEIPITLNISLFGNIELDGDMAIEIIADESNTVNIPVKNTGLYVLNNLELTLDEDMDEYVIDINYPEIHTNETDTIEIELDEMESGSYNASIEITNNDIIKTMNLNVTVFDDFSTDIGYLDDLRQSLHEDMIQLQKDGVFIGSSIEDDIELLQSNINDLNDYYDSGNYSAAKELLDYLETDAIEIETEIINLQTAQISDDDSETYEETDSFCGDDFCDAGELCSCSDCYYEPQCEEIPEDDGGSSSILFVIIFVILLVVGGVIVATSVVPDDWIDKNNKQF